MSLKQSHRIGDVEARGRALEEFAAPRDAPELTRMMAQASDVFGSDEAAERWWMSPAVALRGSRPIDMLETSAGSRELGDYLDRIEFGAYS